MILAATVVILLVARYAMLPPRSGDLPLALDRGSLAAIAASFGRTVSPVTAVVVFSALLAGYVAVLDVVIARG